jgi:hypothetical protein
MLKFVAYFTKKLLTKLLITIVAERWIANWRGFKWRKRQWLNRPISLFFFINREKNDETYASSSQPVLLACRLRYRIFTYVLLPLSFWSNLGSHIHYFCRILENNNYGIKYSYFQWVDIKNWSLIEATYQGWPSRGALTAFEVGT